MKVNNILIGNVKMMECRVILGELIGKVISSMTPMYMKLPLEFTILYPIETCVDLFRTALFRGAVDNCIGASVVNLEGSGWLRLVHIGEDFMDCGPLFGI